MKRIRRTGNPVGRVARPGNWLKTGAASGGGSAPTPAFHALDSSPEVHIGTGGLTCTHADTLYAYDVPLGYYKSFAANVPVWVVDENGDGWLQYYPAATNNMPQSNKLATSPWVFAGVVTPTEDQVGLTGAPNTATKLLRGSGASSSYVHQLASGNARTIVVTAKAGDSAESWLHVLTTTANSYVQVDLVNGVLGPTGGPIVGAELIPVGNGWHRLLMEVGDNNNNVRIYPFGGQPSNVAGPSDDLPGDVIIGNVEEYVGKTLAEVRGLGPIFTTSAAVSVAATFYSFEAANVADDSAWFFELGYDTDQLNCSGSGTHMRLTGNVIFPRGNGQTRLYDGTNILDGLVSWAADETVKYGIAAHSTDAQMSYNAKGVWQADFAYDGSFGITTLALQPPAGNPRSWKYRNLQRYDIASYAEGKTIIDGLMA